MNTAGQKCRVTNEPLFPFLDLGMQPLGNAFSTTLTKEEYRFPMVVGIGERSGLVQLLEQPDAALMFHDAYPFFTGSSKSMQDHFSAYAEDLKESKFWPGTSAQVLEIGCNDASLLQCFLGSAKLCLGVDPAENVLSMARSAGVETEQGFFGEELAGGLLSDYGTFDLIVAANVICHIPDLNSVGRGISNLLSDQGVLVFEEPYWGDVFQLGSYDQFYDEHVFMFSCLSVSNWASALDLELVDVKHQSTHGGSMRYHVARQGRYEKSPQVLAQLQWEDEQRIHDPETLVTFADKVQHSRDALMTLIRKLALSGEKVWAYAATSKSTTVFNYCEFTPNDIIAICDSTPQKQGRFSPGCHIPVVSVDEFHNAAPKFAFLSAWNHSREIWAKERGFVANGGRWITHVPSVGFIEPDTK